MTLESNELSLLPSHEKDFRNESYWNKFFKIRGSNAFEWYGEYENMHQLLDKYVKISDLVLMIGCGNSKLSEKMYDNGTMNITNIDISDLVIKQMTVKNANRHQMKFIKMDMLQMDFTNENFETIIDKGTLDALMSDNSKQVNDDCDKLFSEIDRVIKPGGRYICISLAQSHIAQKILNGFVQKGWIIRIHRIDEQEVEFFLPVFVFVMTKMKKPLSSLMPLIELKFDSQNGANNQFERVQTIDEALLKIKEHQTFGRIKHHIANRDLDFNDDLYLHLYSTNHKDPRYTVYVKDLNGPKANKGPFAAFVVPLGKETDWIFGTKNGRSELAEEANYQRLLIVHLNRSHVYESMTDIIEELSARIMELAPKNLPKSYKTPILSEGPDVDIRDLKYKGFSKFSGEFYVEDVQCKANGHTTRRLIFQNINPVIQTEIILKSGPKTKSKDRQKLTPNYEIFLEDYYATVVAHLYLIKKIMKKQSPLKILLIGLGGGVLPLYLQQWLKDCDIDTVEIDERIKHVAKDWFGLKEDGKLRVHIDDGLKFIRDAVDTGKKWDIVIVDVNSDDPNCDLWCPTPDFVDKDFLSNYKAIVNDDGLFMMNLICRKDSVQKTIFELFSAHWAHMMLNKLEKSRNEILICTNNDNMKLNDKALFADIAKTDVKTLFESLIHVVHL